jgi:hypothetical protein
MLNEHSQAKQFFGLNRGKNLRITATVTRGAGLASVFILPVALSITGATAARGLVWNLPSAAAPITGIPAVTVLKATATTAHGARSHLKPPF